MLATKALLADNPDPTEDEVRWALSGNLCRCTGYVNIVRAVRAAASAMRDPEEASEPATGPSAERAPVGEEVSA
jgi:aerobic carbon-monoxide dehydrogenase small subunit